ncbi:MAG: adenylosuccinate synthase, partial [Bacteroidetes bacterium GWE2_29_8]
MSVDVLLGLQWGDEGKGKIIDVLTPKYDIVARFQGGPNAGHTLMFDKKKIVLHTIPSGVFHQSKNIIGNGVVIDPIEFIKEVDDLINAGAKIFEKLLISKKANLILPTHKLLDKVIELSKGVNKIGSTLRGIGPAYSDKISRQAIRIGDLSNNEEFINKYNSLSKKHFELIDFYKKQYNLEIDDIDFTLMEKKWFEGIELIKKFRFIDSEIYINEKISNNKNIIAEGAQGTMLDIDFGTYPFVTSSNTTTAGVCTGLGIPPTQINDVIGIFKAYTTRVGAGPFPTELNDANGDKLREYGKEFGSTTGRSRRCGWLDLPILRYAIMINGVTKLVMMKADVLDNFEAIKICTHYEYDGKIISHPPYSLENNNVKPIYKVMKGWNKSI